MKTKDPLILSIRPDLCRILHQLYNLKNVKSTNRGVILSVRLQAETWNFTESISTPWVFFTFFKLYKWYKIAQSIYIKNRLDLIDRINTSLDLWSSILKRGAAFDKTEWKLTLRAKPKLTWKKCWTCKSNKYKLKKLNTYTLD